MLALHGTIVLEREVEKMINLPDAPWIGNPPEEKPKYKCYQCNETIWEGDKYYQFDNECFCSKGCVLEYIELEEKRA